LSTSGVSRSEAPVVNLCIMMKPMKIKLFSVVLLALPAFAQSGADAIKDSLVKHWKITGDFTIAVAKMMPAADYGFRPVPEELSFGQLMIQISGANISACSNASGMPRLPIPPAISQALKDEKIDAGKDSVIKFMTHTFDFCNQAVASMTPEKLHAMVGPKDRQMTGFEWLWAYFTHTAHHRGQAEVYLRVKGIKPPDYVF
jgi:hypothetical protein